MNSAGATAAFAKSDVGVRLQQNVGDLNAGRQKEPDLNEANRSADTWRWYGDKLIRGSSWGGEKIREFSKGSEDEGKWKVGAAVVELGGGAAGLGLQYKSIQRRAAGQNAAANTAADKLIQNQERAAAGFTANQDAYVRQMTEIHQRYSQDQIAAVRAGADQAAGGATRGTSITMGGINRGAAIELKANRAMFDGSVAAAGQIRDAALHAARLHMAATIMHHMTPDAARQIEQELTLPY